MNPEKSKLAAADDDGRIRIVGILKKESGGVKAFRAKHENIVSTVDWINHTLLVSSSADQSIKSWQLRDQKCIRTLDISGYKNEVGGMSKVNVSPPLIHTLVVLKRGDLAKFIAAGCENGNIIINKLDNGRVSTGKTATKVYTACHQWGIGSLAVREAGNGWEMVSGSNDSHIKVWPYNYYRL